MAETELTKGGQSNGQGITLVVGILTILATLATAIPAFISLTRDRADVYFHTESFSVLNPNSPDYANIKNVLQQNHIPDSRLVLEIVNTGDSLAREVKVGVNVDGTIGNISSTPSNKQQPVWVILPDLDGVTGQSVANISVKELSPGKILKFDIGYFSSAIPERSVNVDVFFDGKPANLVPDIVKTTQQTIFRIFMWPLIILGVGVLLTLLISASIVVMRRPALGDAVLSFLLAILSEPILGVKLSFKKANQKDD